MSSAQPSNLSAPLSKNKRRKLKREQEAAWKEVSAKPAKKREDGDESAATESPARKEKPAPKPAPKPAAAAAPASPASATPTKAVYTAGGPVTASDFNLDDVSDPSALLASAHQPAKKAAAKKKKPAKK